MCKSVCFKQMRYPIRQIQNVFRFMFLTIIISLALSLVFFLSPSPSRSHWAISSQRIGMTVRILTQIYVVRSRCKGSMVQFLRYSFIESLAFDRKCCPFHHGTTITTKKGTHKCWANWPIRCIHIV